jgi:hypothetical protein
MAYPIIVLVDNDDGAKDIFNMLKGKKFKIDLGYEKDDLFYHVSGPLYIVKTPPKGEDNKSCIEDLFDPTLLTTKIGGKSFNPDKEHEADGEYGKVVFAEQVVRPQAGIIDFSGFEHLLKCIGAVIDDYAKRKLDLPPTVPRA